MSAYRMLVIEDDPRIADLICRVAQDVGFTVESACGPAEIEKRYEQLQPDVITLDILMPDMDGLEVLQFLRQQFSTARIVILSGSDGLSHEITENMGTMLGLTIETNLYKPFRVDELRQVFKGIKNSITKSRKLMSTKDVA